MMDIKAKNRNFQSLRSYLKLLCLVVLVMALFLLPQPAHADWQVPLRIESGDAYNRLVIGTDATASDGYDSLWDTYALMTGDIEAYFSHPEWNMVHTYFQRDIRAHAPGSSKIWGVTLNSTLSNSTFTITWDISKLPAGYPAVLVDESTGQQTDMRTTPSYSFTYTGIRSFTITVTETVPCVNLPARVVRAVPQDYQTLQEAYDAAADGEAIRARAVEIAGDLNINLNKSVIIDGGFDCDYMTQTGSTTLNGTLTITNGIVTIGDVVSQ